MHVCINTITLVLEVTRHRHVPDLDTSLVPFKNLIVRLLLTSLLEHFLFCATRE